VRVINISTPRSGTMSIQRFGALLGVPSYHQHLSFTTKEAHLIPYNLDDWPEAVKEHLKKIEAKLPNGNYLNSDWGVGWLMYPIHKTWPDIAWLITVRDPIENANSLRRIRHKTEPAKYSVKFYGRNWHHYYEFITEQAKRMDPPPYCLEFDRLVKGEYIGFLCGLFGKKENEQLRAHWAKKINSLGRYPVHALDASFLLDCHALRQRLKEVCNQPC